MFLIDDLEKNLNDINMWCRLKWATKHLNNILHVTSSNILQIFVYHMVVFFVMWKIPCWCAKCFTMWTKVWLQNTQLIWFWRYLFVKMVVLNYGINLRVFWKFLETLTKIKKISSSKYDKNIVYFRNDFQYIVKLIIPISSLEVFHKH
jgi:hypothetical protein